MENYDVLIAAFKTMGHTNRSEIIAAALLKKSCDRKLVLKRKYEAHIIVSHFILYVSFDLEKVL